MVKVFMGLKGSGKTKKLIELVNHAVNEEAGNVICVEYGPKLTYDISHRARLIDAKIYDIEDYSALKGFVSGVYAGNFDITHIFIDSLYKIAGSDDIAQAEEFVEWLDKFNKEHNVKFTVTISDDEARATDNMKKYF